MPGRPTRRRSSVSPCGQLDPQEKEQVQTTGTLVVEDVTGPAAAAGVQPGDIILGINGKRVKTVEGAAGFGEVLR